MDAADEVPGAEARLLAAVADARRDDAAHVEVFALDALARTAFAADERARAIELAATADERMEAASHFITDLDRTDARWLRSLSEQSPPRAPA